MSYFDSTDLWMGDSDKANANIRLDAANSEITIASGGNITNSGNDYSITDDGFNVTENSNFLSRNAYTIGDNRGAFWGDGTDIILEARDLLGADLNLRALGGTINLNNPGSASDTHLYGFNYFERFQHQEDETRSLPDTGEQALTIDAPIVRITSISSTTAILTRFDQSTTPNTDRSFSFILVNETSNRNVTFRDESSTSFSGANIITPNNVDREFQKGARIAVTYISSTGNYHINQDRN